MDTPLLCKVDAVTVPVPDLDSGLEFYVGQLRHRLLWRNDDIGQAAVALRDSDTESATPSTYEPNCCRERPSPAVFELPLSPAFDIPVGRVAVVTDPF